MSDKRNMDDNTFTGRSVRQSLELARELATRAAGEFSQTARDAEAAESMGRVVATLDMAGRALEAADPVQATAQLTQAREAIASVRCGRESVEVATRDADLGLDLLAQAMSAIDRTVHRIQNSTSRDMKYGAIRTPRAERLP